MTKGALVREIETDAGWVLYKGTAGIVLGRADHFEEIAGISGSNRHWWVSWGTGDIHVMNISDIEVIDND